MCIKAQNHWLVTVTVIRTGQGHGGGGGSDNSYLSLAIQCRFPYGQVSLVSPVFETKKGRVLKGFNNRQVNQFVSDEMGLQFK